MISNPKKTAEQLVLKHIRDHKDEQSIIIAKSMAEKEIDDIVHEYKLETISPSTHRYWQEVKKEIPQIKIDAKIYN